MITGLTQSEVFERYKSGDRNYVEQKSGVIKNIIFSNIFSSYNILIFIIVSFLLIFYFRTGASSLLFDSWGVFSIILVNTSIAIFQEIKARKALEKVSLIMQKTAKVMRDGKLIEIDQQDLVKDDVVYVERGDQICADGKVIDSTRLELDESLLTGESEPVIKNNKQILLSGSFVLSGSGYFVVEKFGKESYAGKITQIAKDFKLATSPLQAKINKIIRILLLISLTLIILSAISHRGSVLKVDNIRQYTTTLIGLVPQGLVFLSTITYAIGIFRISRLGAIVQKTTAIETFASVNVVCMDKTGTLTKNLLSVQEITNLSKFDIKDVKKLIGTYASLTKYKNATINAIDKYASYKTAKFVQEFPFSSSRKMSMLKVNIDGEDRILFLGALDLYDKHISKDTDADFDKIKDYRNLVFAEIVSDEELDNIAEVINDKNLKFIPVAIISISDTVREDSLEALNLFKQKNIDFKILSGDSVNAIRAILTKLDINLQEDDFITGEELEKFTGKELVKLAVSKKVFARLKPEQKEDLILSLKAQGLIISMIGDGVNDLPAIKKSDLGIAMFEGSQITKEISDIVLVENKFSLLPRIFDEGNKIVNTILYSSRLFFTKNFFIAITTLLSIVFSFQFFLTPRSISFVNIFAISIPAFLLSIFNDDVVGNKQFLKKSLTYAITAALLLSTTVYIVYYLNGLFFKHVPAEELRMSVISYIVFAAIANLIVNISFTNISNNNKKILFAFVISLILFFFICVYIDVSRTFLVWLKIIYEINYLRPELLIIPFCVVLLNTGILAFVLNLFKDSVYKKEKI